MWYFFVIAGIFGGIIAGMGMGGGTLLIPILTLFLGLSQHLSQELNLLVFIPTATIAVILHLKNKLLDFKTFLWIVFPAICSSVGFSFLANFLDDKILKLIFGIFLFILGVVLLILAILKKIKSKNWTTKLGI